MTRTTCVCLIGLALSGCIYDPLPWRPEVDGGRPRGSGDAADLRDTGTPPTGALEAPPISGGTLLARADGVHVVAASADTDSIYEIAMPPSLAVTRTIALSPGSQAGRIAEDGAGRIHVVLRATGEVATIEPGASVARVRHVCASPRGIAWRASDDALLVACAEGLLVTLPAAGGIPTQSFSLDDDLRDVVIAGDRVLVSRFRSAEVLAIDPDGSIAARWVPATVVEPDALAPFDPSVPAVTLAPHVAWRMIPAPRGAWLLHQRHRVSVIPAALGAGVASVPYYGGGFGGGSPILESVVSFVDAAQPSGPLAEGGITHLALGADLALSDMGVLFAASVASADQRSSVVTVVTSSDEAHQTWLTADQPVGLGITSIASIGTHVVLLQRDPLRVVVVSPETVGFPSVATLAIDPRVARDSGSRSFHTVTASGLACASCHPDGADDGHVWAFGDAAPVRTQNLLGGVLATAPFHWEGDLPDFAALMIEVYQTRMSGLSGAVDGGELASWIDALPLPARPSPNPAAVARGRALFESTEVGCSSCHSGAEHTDNLTVDVGTGGAFQVPRLTGVVQRAPYFHSGCAATLRDRFTGDPTCTGGESHGHTSALLPSEIDDLVSYLESL